MTAAFEWAKDQQNLITFVMIDGSGGEVTGLGNGLTMQISKAGGSFAAVAGTQDEIGQGWYKYLSTAGEADTDGPVSLTATGAGAIQQNLEYVVTARNIYGVFFTYTVTDSVTTLPISGAVVSISTDLAGQRVIFSGVTDSIGVLRHVSTGQLPFLDPNDYYFWTSAPGYVFNNPDLETVS